MKQLSNFSSPTYLSPTPVSDYNGINTSTRYDDGTANAAYLIFIPAAIIVFILITVFGAHKWQNREEQSNSSLCQVLRHRIFRSCSPRQLRTQTNNSGTGHFVTESNRDSTVMLIEELTDINTDVWNDECDDLNAERPNTDMQLQVTNSHSPSSTDSETCICNVEVHSDSLIQEEDLLPPSSVHRSGSANLSLATAYYVDDDDVSTQQLDISPILTSSSFYSAHSTSVPSITSSENTIHSTMASPISISTTPTTSEDDNDDMNKTDLAQEIVDVVQSEGFAMATAEVLHSGSSHFSLFTVAQEGRGYQSNTDTELSDSTSTTPVRIEGSSLTRNNRAGNGQEHISLFELDRMFDSSTMRENWDQTTL